MFRHLQIYDRRERLLVGLADLLLGLVAPFLRLSGLRRAAGPADGPRILLLRLERIGDLLMAIDAIRAVRAAAPNARIDLVVGSWNGPLARLLPEVDEVEVLDVPWLARRTDAPGWPGLARRALSWRPRRYELAINFEGDVRSHLLLALSGASRRVGFDMAGGGPLLTDRVPYDPRIHVAENAHRLVRCAFGGLPAAPPTSPARLLLPDDARIRADELLGIDAAGRSDSVSWPGCRFVGIQAGGGREVKQWDLARLAEVAARLARARHTVTVLTGSSADRPVVDRLKQHLPTGIPTLDLAGRVDLVTLAAVLERLALLITPDTGPMHLAAAVGTPILAVHGPSDPARWGPRSTRARVVRIDLPCSPCNRIRRPPARCAHGVPACLSSIGADEVYEAARALLDGGCAGSGRDGVPDGR